MRKKYLAILSVAALFLFSFGMIASKEIVSPVMNQDFLSRCRPTIIVDAGHGGVDGGAVGIAGIYEKNINLQISLYLRSMLEVFGFRVIMTRETDCSIHDSDSVTIRQKKTSDLHNRFKIISQNPNAIFLSIHQNKFEQASSRGTQIFYSKNNPESKALAGILQKTFKSSLQVWNHRAEQKAGKSIYLLWNAESPAVLIESAFLSNPEEANKISQPVYQKQVSFTILNGLMNYITQTSKT